MGIESRGSTPPPGLYWVLVQGESWEPKSVEWLLTWEHEQVKHNDPHLRRVRMRRLIGRVADVRSDRKFWFLAKGNEPFIHTSTSQVFPVFRFEREARERCDQGGNLEPCLVEIIEDVP